MKIIKENENYLIDREGDIISISYQKGKMSAFLTPSKDKDGYLLCALKHKWYKVHRLVAQHFLNNPLNKKNVNHINGIKSDNRVENLEWCTHKENMQHAVLNNLNGFAKGEKSPKTKLKNDDIRKIRFLKNNGYTSRQLAEIYNISFGSIRKIVYNERWKHIEKMR